jgi:hypothetical protein
LGFSFYNLLTYIYFHTTVQCFAVAGVPTVAGIVLLLLAPMLLLATAATGIPVLPEFKLLLASMQRGPSPLLASRMLLVSMLLLAAGAAGVPAVLIGQRD